MALGYKSQSRFVYSLSGLFGVRFLFFEYKNGAPLHR